MLLRAGEGVACRGDRHGPDAQLLQVTLDGGLAVAAVGGHRAGTRPVRLTTRLMAGTSCGPSGAAPHSTA
jgi:hypothetical protein